MTKKKKHTLYGVLVAVALGALALDTLTRGSDAPAPAADPAPAPVRHDAPAGKAATPPTPARPADCTAAVAAQLAGAARAHRIDITRVADAFAFAPPWPIKQERPTMGAPAGAPAAAPLPDLKLTGTMVSGGRRVAIINSRVVGIGDELSGYTVVAIEPRAVVLRGADAEFRLELQTPALDGGR